METLNLNSNAISEQGMQELAAAIARGGLPSCTMICRGGNPGSAAPVEEALATHTHRMCVALASKH